MAAEMAVIRLTHVADLPTPEDLVRRLKDATPPTPPNGGGTRPVGAAPGAAVQATSSASVPSGAATALAPQSATALAHYPTFQNVVNLIRSSRDQVLMIEVETYVRLAAYSPGRIEFEPAPQAPQDLAAKLGRYLQERTGARWAISVVAEGGEPSIAEVRDRKLSEARERAMEHPLVKSVLETFPGAKIGEIRSPKKLAEEAALDALPEVDEEWDPFEED